jgi:hypothetical protein
MAIDVTLYAVSDDPADSNLYPVQASIVNGRAQLYTQLVVNQEVVVRPADICYAGYFNTPVNPGGGGGVVMSIQAGIEDLTKSLVVTNVFITFVPDVPQDCSVLATVIGSLNSGLIAGRLYLNNGANVNAGFTDIGEKNPIKLAPGEIPQLVFSSAPTSSTDFTGASTAYLWGYYE